MNNQDIDELIATRIMGWEKRQAYFHPSNPKYWFDGDSSERQIIANAWRPSTNIAQAWEVVEKMIEKGFYINIGTDDLNQFFCALVYGETSIEEDGIQKILKEKVFSAEEKTAPLAICLAALKAVEGSITNEQGD